MLRLGRGLRFPFLIGLLLAALGGCNGDKCEELPAQAQIDVVLEGNLTGDVDSSEVVLTINGEKEVSHSFGKAAPSFVFKFEEFDRAPRTLEVSVTVFDKDGKVLGTGQLDTTFSSDGCNFFTVVVRPGVVSCTQGASCTPTNVCHVGEIDCGSGVPSCTDTGANVPNGTSCGTNMVCGNGVCNACTQGMTCQPSTPCKTGEIECSSGSPVCNETGDVTNGTSCGTNMWCNNGTCTAAGGPPSCWGAASCGTYSCCDTIQVPGGSYPMGRSDSGTDAYASGDSDEQPEHTATLSAFNLDRFEVTVGRMRRFMAQYDGTPPAANVGAHPLISGSGWQTGWDGNLPASQSALIADLKCHTSLRTWTDVAGANENYPANCVSWYVAFAFCVWDGGRLPTEAEWEMAAAGGSENRLYPWGSAAPDATRANYSGGANSPFMAVGSTPAGAGRWGHHDIAGSMWEWVFDWHANYTTATCNNCAETSDGLYRVERGGGWYDPGAGLRAADRLTILLPAGRAEYTGFRCARPAA